MKLYHPWSTLTRGVIFIPIFPAPGKWCRKDGFMATKYKQYKDGTYRTRIWDGTYNPDGSKHRVNLKSDKSSKDLEKKVAAFQKAVKEGLSVQTTDQTFCGYAEQWLSTYKAVRENGTKAMYRNIIHAHFSALEGIALRDISRIHLQLIINNAADKPRTCQQIRMTFQQVISSAILDGYLPEKASQMFDSVDIPKYISPEKRALTPEEVRGIKTADFSPMDRTYVYILYGCGLRRGEVLALQPSDIRLKAAELAVRRSLEFIGNDSAIKAPKSANGVRTVPIPGFLLEHLKEYLPQLRSSYLIHTRDGSKMTASAYRRMWERITRQINLAAGGTENLWVIRNLTAHIFRHNYCTQLCYQIPSISTKQIAKLMGDREEMIIRVYSHILEEKEDVTTAITSAIAL